MKKNWKLKGQFYIFAYIKLLPYLDEGKKKGVEHNSRLAFKTKESVKIFYIIHCYVWIKQENQ